MDNVQSRLEQIGNFFKGLVPEGHCGHYKIKGVDAPILVWGETSDVSREHGDDMVMEQPIYGLLYYETDTDFDPVFDEIQEKLNEKMDAWRWVNSYYDAENELIRHEWEWVIDCYE